MPNTNYVICTVAFAVFLLVGAIVIQDIGTVFEFVAAFAVSGLAFLFPGYFTIAAAKKYATDKQKE